MINKLEITVDILAQCMHDCAPGTSVEDWKSYIEANGHDAKKFFGANGVGYNEYLSFIETYDKSKHDRKVAEKLNKRGKK